jgi:hypothetical protein
MNFHHNRCRGEYPADPAHEACQAGRILARLALDGDRNIPNMLGVDVARGAA